MKKLLLIATLLLIILSCSNEKKMSKHKSKKNTVVKAFIANDFSEYSRQSATTQILNATVTDSILTLKISYDGGCKKHTFDLIGSQFIQKSLPPIRGIMLVHYANNEDCRELIEEEISFNISDFKYPNGDIMLNLQGYKPKIKYTDVSKN